MPPTSKSPQTGINMSPPSSNVSPRPLGRSTTLGDLSASPARLRRESALSDTLSEARYSIRSSTSGLFLPRPHSKATPESHDDDSYWQSAPLALALLPAVAGIFFQNGSAVITDVTLLILAAVFLNWSVRLPWEWYTSAQQVERVELREAESDMEAIAEEQDDEESTASPGQRRRQQNAPPLNENVRTARHELHIHEMLALASCFVFPMVGAWVLHAIRSQLSRPSEGLVSNYNITIFLFAAEIRPLSHLLKLLQARTLYLQRVVSVNSFAEARADASQVSDLSKRLEELEAHVAESASRNSMGNSPQKYEPGREKENYFGETTAKIGPEAWNQFQAELEALKRAVRKYERRTTVSAFDTDKRLYDMEARMDEVIAMATAAHQKRNASGISTILSPVTMVCRVIASLFRTLRMVICVPKQLSRWFWRKITGTTGSDEALENQKAIRNKTSRRTHSAGMRQHQGSKAMKSES